MTLYVGTSGWQYRHWRETFYPRGLPQAEWLQYFADRFQCVEVNNTFYRLPTRRAVAAWAQATPDDFVIGVKFSRYLTHLKRLRGARQSIDLFFQRIEPLGKKLGPVLVQLPEQVGPDLSRLDDVLSEMPRGVRVAVELRHRGWFTKETYALLRRHDAALCLADRGSRPVTPLERTASWGYIRFHEGRASPAPCYGRQSLNAWAGRIAGLWDAKDDVYAFFNNDTRACALHDAQVFARLARRDGLAPTRVPAPGDVHLG